MCADQVLVVTVQRSFGHCFHLFASYMYIVRTGNGFDYAYYFIFDGTAIKFPHVATAIRFVGLAKASMVMNNAVFTA